MSSMLNRLQLNRLRLMQDILLPLALCGMEASWASQAALWLTKTQRGGEEVAFSWLWVLLLLTFAAMSTRIALRLEISLGEVRWNILALAVTSIFVVTRFWYFADKPFYDQSWLPDTLGYVSQFFVDAPQLGIGLLIGAFLWHRGISIARSELALETVYDYFLNGVVALIFLGILAPSWPGVNDADRAGQAVSVLLFFACALVALAISRLEIMRRSIQDVADPLPDLNQHWFGLLSAVVLFVLAISLLASTIFSFDLVGILLGFVTEATTYVLYAIVLITIPFFFVLEQVVYGIKWLLTLFGFQRPTEPPRLRSLDDFRPEQDELTQGGLPPEVIATIRFTIAVLLILIVLLILLRAIYRQLTNERGNPDEIRESVWSWNDIWQGLQDGLQALLNALPLRSGNDDAGDGQSGLEPRIRATRELYRLFLAWAAQRGVSRRSEQTPFEFLHIFRQELPVVETQAVLITNLYVAVRYNDRPPAEDDLRGAITAWNQLRATPQDKPATS